MTAARLPGLRDAAALAWPASLAAIVTPILGLVDTAVLSRAAGPSDLAGVALAGAVFSLVYWTLGGLRMSAAGLSAQAHGASDEAALRAHLVKAALIAGAVGLVILVCKHPIRVLAEAAMTGGTEASPAARAAMVAYTDIRLWGAVSVALTNALLGWLIGQGRLGLVMGVLVAVTALNAALDAWFVLGLGMGVRGIAYGTLIAELAGGALCGLAVLYVLHRRGGVRIAWVPGRFAENLRGVMAFNTDMLVRTLVLALVFAWFVRAGGRFGDVTLAANQVLLTLVLVTTLLIDGGAVAAQTLVGQALGAREHRRARFDAAVRVTTQLSAGITVALFVLLLLAGGPILAQIVPRGSEAGAVLAEARRFLPWVIAAPLVLAASFQLDGIFIGATRGRALRNGMIISAGAFALGAFALPPLMGNHGLWLAFALFFAARAATLMLVWSGFDRLAPRPTGGLTDAAGAPS